MPRPIHVLTGCTAVGKTELALRWAEAHGAEIVSCDSLLFYRGADIGTAKPSPAELARVPHHLVDCCDLADRMDVTQYVIRARKAVMEILARGRQVLVTGGSGFYLKAFFAPVADEVAVAPDIREGVRQRLASAGLASLVEELQRLNPAGLGGLDIQNPRRVTRALERCLASGRTLGELQAAFDALPSAFADLEVRLCQLVREPAELDARITTRVEQMVRAGLVAEVRGLLERGGLKENPSVAGAIGYRETIDFLEGRLAESDLTAVIARNTRALVKKQRTWFKTQLPVHPLVPADSADPGRLFAAPV
ncbi:tRNA dimethylallyltransferase [Lacunisphaera limnophila]|uniref:tRNA dimethylallyltransferase n=1 Tax=Lacunisphaera limnophila TaxID=1838286 RepID=A0A1D8AWF9_9BACT|nr:tRNA (adenosine(37)-N6)-dimethylallyltransferase MiaA [Lacunisphaera limnophila]AOS45238.1 tRNA dimethylallyltransferase [Lacunisphaera limnophila]